MVNIWEHNVPGEERAIIKLGRNKLETYLEVARRPGWMDQSEHGKRSS